MALSFVTTAAPITQSVGGSVRSLLEASSLSITGFTEPLTLALFTSRSLSGNQNNASLSSNSVISAATIVQSSSKETNHSSSLHIISPVTQDVVGSSAGDINTTKTLLSSSKTFSGGLSSDSSTSTLSTSDLLSDHRSNSSSVSFRSDGIASPHSFLSSSQIRTTIMQTVSTATGNFMGTTDSTEVILSKSVTVAGSLDYNSQTWTSLVVNNSSAYVHQSDSTETLRSTEHDGSFYSNATPGATSRSYSGTQLEPSKESDLLTSRTDVAMSTMSSLTTTVHGSKAPASNEMATHSLSPSISVSEPSRIDVHSSYVTVVSYSPLGKSSIKTLQLNQTTHGTFGNSRPSETRQSSEFLSSSNRVSVTTTMEQISTFDKQTLDVSTVVTSYPEVVIPNTSVKDKGQRSTALSLFTVPEISTKQASLSQAESTVNNSYVSLPNSPSISNSLQPFPTSKTLFLSNSSLTYSGNSMSASVLMSTKSLSASLNVPQETSGRSSITPETSQPMKTTLHSSQVLPSLSFQSKERNSISTQFTPTVTRQSPYSSLASSISSLIVSNSSSNSTSNLSQTTAILPLPSSEYMGNSTIVVSLVRASTTLGNTKGSVFTSSSFNVTSTTVDSTSQVFVTATITQSSNGSVADTLRSSLKMPELETATSYISSKSSEDNTIATVSNLTPSVLPTSSSYLVSATYSTGLSLESRRVSFSQSESSGASVISTFIKKQSTPFISITPIFKTSFSAEKITNDFIPTLTLSTVTMATSKSDSTASQLVATNASYSRSMTKTASPSVISSSVAIKTVYSFLVANTASVQTEQNQTHASSTLLGFSLATFEETPSRATSRPVSVYGGSSFVHEKSSKFQESRNK